MEQVTETQTNTEESASERMRRAWATRRANAAATAEPKKVRVAKKVETKADVVTAVVRRGRPRKDVTTVTAKVKTQKGSQYPFYLSHTQYSLDQVQELGVLAVTTDGQTYRLLKTELGPVSARSVSVA